MFCLSVSLERKKETRLIKEFKSIKKYTLRFINGQKIFHESCIASTPQVGDVSFKHYKNIPATAPVMHVAKVPATMKRNPKDTISSMLPVP